MKISIITCSYNNREGVRASIEAVRSQRSEAVEIEHLIIDGGSKDGTADALRAWETACHGEAERRLGDRRQETGYEIKWISEPDKGLYDALNMGLRMATGDVIGILHTDDVWEEGILKRVLDAFEERPDVRIQRLGGSNSESLPSDFSPLTAHHPDGVYGDLLYVDAADITKVKRVWKSGEYDPKKWYNGWMPPHPALFVTRELAERVGEYRLDLGSAADYEWMLRAGLVHAAKLVYIGDLQKESAQQKGSARVFSTFFHSKFSRRKNVKNHGLTPFAPFVRMRVGGQSNVSVMARLKANRNDRRAWELNGLRPRPWTLIMKPLRKLPQWVAAKRGRSH